MPLVPGALIATAALKVPGLATNGTGFTVTNKSPGKLPAAVLTLSQDIPLLVIGVAVKLVTVELELDSETVCDVATVLPLAKTKLREFGPAEMGLGPPVEFVLSVTGTDRVVVPDWTLIKPTSTPVVVGAPAPMEAVTTKGVAPD